MTAMAVSVQLLCFMNLKLYHWINFKRKTSSNIKSKESNKWVCYKSEKFGHSKSCGSCPKIWTIWFYHRVMHPKNADRMASSVDPDQTAFWSGSTPFVLTCLPKNLVSLRRVCYKFKHYSDFFFRKLWSHIIRRTGTAVVRNILTVKPFHYSCQWRRSHKNQIAVWSSEISSGSRTCSK